MGHRSGMRVAGVDACRRGWVAVSLAAVSLAPGGPAVAVRVGPSLEALLAPDPDLAGTTPPELDMTGTTIVGIDMPLGLLEAGWREADRAARGLLGPRRSSVFAIPPRAVWAETSYPAANQRCRELTGQGFSMQAWGLRAKLLEANRYRQMCGHPLYEVHPELAFGAVRRGRARCACWPRAGRPPWRRRPVPDVPHRADDRTSAGTGWPRAAWPAGPRPAR